MELVNYIIFSRPDLLEDIELKEKIEYKLFKLCDIKNISCNSYCPIYNEDKSYLVETIEKRKLNKQDIYNIIMNKDIQVKYKDIYNELVDKYPEEIKIIQEEKILTKLVKDMINHIDSDEELIIDYKNMTCPCFKNGKEMLKRLLND